MSKNIWKYLCILLTILLVVTNAFWAFNKPQPVTQNINFAYQVGFHYGPSIIMDELDLIESNSGGRYKGSYFMISGGSTINEAILAGSIDFAQMSSAAAIKGIDKGLGTKMLSSFGAKEHELWTWREDIQTLEDLGPGIIVSVVKLNSIEHTGLIKAFCDMGRTKEDADEICGFFSHSDSYQMMEAGEIDAHFAGVPYTVEYASDPRYHKIATDSSIWGMNLPGGIIMGKCDDAELRTVVLESFIEAIRWIEDNPERASEIIGAVLGYDAEEAWELWQKSGIIWGETVGLGAVEAQAGTMYDIGLLNQKLSVEDLLFPETIEMMEG